ncbi:OmpA family protein [Flavobacteriales bacterium]|jgi:outer membrane protein OmpA-like peptidoglycan-associated protein|nr:OmpA family protein [Flavobacteriales bacterium]
MKKLIPIILVAILFTSCATLLRKDTKESVTFSTDPPNAEVFINGNKVGNSPVTVSLETTDAHTIQYKLKGYPTTNYSLEGDVLPKYVVGDIAIGGAVLAWIPLIVDNHTNKWRGFNQYEIDGHADLSGKNGDKDGDGILDKDDDCPTVRGTKEFNGCPDSDGDGIRDMDDLCPSTKGIAKYKGCPEMKDALQGAKNGVFFETGSSKLSTKSYSVLNQLADLMIDKPNNKLYIEGHTDNTGEHDNNVLLSKNRALAVKSYLSQKGIADDRMSTNGFGPDKPMDTN